MGLIVILVALLPAILLWLYIWKKDYGYKTSLNVVVVPIVASALLTMRARKLLIAMAIKVNRHLNKTI